MLQLHYFPGNASLIVHIVLEEIGAPFTLKYVDRARSAHKSRRVPRAQPERADPGPRRRRCARRRRRAARPLRDRRDLPAPGRHASGGGAAAGARHARARACLQVARLVHEHAAGRAHPLLLSRALGRRRRRRRGRQGACRDQGRRDARPDRRPARAPRRALVPRRPLQRRRSLCVRALPLDARLRPAGARACRTSSPGSIACWRGRRCSARSRARS